MYARVDVCMLICLLWEYLEKFPCDMYSVCGLGGLL